MTHIIIGGRAAIEHVRKGKRPRKGQSRREPLACRDSSWLMFFTTAPLSMRGEAEVISLFQLFDRTESHYALRTEENLPTPQATKISWALKQAASPAVLMALCYFFVWVLAGKSGPVICNDGSRLAAIESLAVRGTWDISDSMFVGTCGQDPSGWSSRRGKLLFR